MSGIGGAPSFSGMAKNNSLIDHFETVFNISFTMSGTSGAPSFSGTTKNNSSTSSSYTIGQQAPEVSQADKRARRSIIDFESINEVEANFDKPTSVGGTKQPKGRHLTGDHIIYDIDVRLHGEVQPELDVTPITKYASDPSLVLGRQIAVNNTYICYPLKMGAISILNINTALRSLLKGHVQKVTDMAFFSEDVNLLASASTDGHVYVWKIVEDLDEYGEKQITTKVVIAVQIEEEPVHPQVCWHCQKEEVLVVGIGNRILRLDIAKVTRGKVYSADKPLICPVDKLIDGIEFVGKHDGEVTDLSMCQSLTTTRLVSSSVDGTVKIWEDDKSSPIAVLRPHDGLPVNSVRFMTAPHRPDHIILLTGGPLNREIKLWPFESEEGWLFDLFPTDAGSWRCTQTLELKSSGESRIEDAFFNQVVALSMSGILLLANSKKNAIYALHLDYWPNTLKTRLDYITEFKVNMPILSFTGTNDVLPNGDQTVEVYCVQSQAIQQYSLELSQCLPPPSLSVLNSTDSVDDLGVTKDTVNSESSPSQTLSSELTDVQKKLMSLAVDTASFEVSELSNGSSDVSNDKTKAPMDQTEELSRMAYEHKYEEAFTAVLLTSDVRIVSWLCSQVYLQKILTSNPVPLSQWVLLSLLQQLALDIRNNTFTKLGWMMDVVVAINPKDEIIAMHARPILEQVHSILNHQMSVSTSLIAELSSLRIVTRLLNLMLGSM